MGPDGPRWAQWAIASPEWKSATFPRSTKARLSAAVVLVCPRSKDSLPKAQCGSVTLSFAVHRFWRKAKTLKAAMSSKMLREVCKILESLSVLAKESLLFSCKFHCCILHPMSHALAMRRSASQDPKSPEGVRNPQEPIWTTQMLHECIVDESAPCACCCEKWPRARLVTEFGSSALWLLPLTEFPLVRLCMNQSGMGAIPVRS